MLLLLLLLLLLMCGKSFKTSDEDATLEKILRKQNIHFLSNDVFEQQGKAKNKV